MRLGLLESVTQLNSHALRLSLPSLLQRLLKLHTICHKLYETYRQIYL